MRAASIAIDNVKGVAGLITPGDRVDVIAVPSGGPSQAPRGYAIVRGAVVLAMGTDVETTTAAAPGLLVGPAAGAHDRHVGTDAESSRPDRWSRPQQLPAARPAQSARSDRRAFPPRCSSSRRRGPPSRPPPRRRLTPPAPPAPAGPVDAVPRCHGHRRRSGRRGPFGFALSQRVFIVTGAKGGVGTTTIAINLAQRFPALGERVIVDADLSGKRSLAVWFDVGDQLESSPCDRLGYRRHDGDGTFGDGIGANVRGWPRSRPRVPITRSIAGLSENALIVVDAPQPFAATVRPFIARASKIILITEPTLMGVSAARAKLATMDRAGVPATQIALAVCDIVGNGGLTRAEIERELALPVSAELSNTRDRKFEALFDGFVTMLSGASPLNDPAGASEKPVFDRRIDAGEALL